jgi:GH25 family lysozyme M1 (1,4-beta-N-acetylmuramidase)
MQHHRQEIFRIVRKYVAARIPILLFFAIAVSPKSALAVDCDGGASVTLEFICRTFEHYIPRGARLVDDRIASRFPPAGPDDSGIRSFAFVVSVSKYPNMTEPQDRDLLSVREELPRILNFLRDQQFDEIIVLRDEEATAERIRQVFDSYLIPQIRDQYRNRARFLFAYDGHGARGSDGTTLAGGLALSETRGDNDNEEGRVFELSDLRGRLEKVGTFAYQSLALLGSCYSGGIFTVTSSQGENFSAARGPGAHIVAASRGNELAWTLPDRTGTIFFQFLMDAVEGSTGQGRDRGFVYDVTSNRSLPISNTEILRLGGVINSITERLEPLTNSLTGQSYPQLRVGPMAPGRNYPAAFFFLAPPRSRENVFGAVISSADRGASVRIDPNTGSEIEITGSAVRGSPNLLIFNPSDTYQFHGVNVSYNDGNIDFAELREAGIHFSYVRATQGALFRDPLFLRNWNEARLNSLITGASHVFEFCHSVEAQFENITNTVPIIADSIPLTIAIEQNFELNSDLPGENCRTLSGVQDNILRLAHLLQEYYGKSPVINITNSSQMNLFSDSFNNYSIWLTNTLQSFDNFSASAVGPWTIWQFTDSRPRAVTSSGRLPSLAQSVFFGNSQQMDEFIQGRPNIALAASAKCYLNLPNLNIIELSAEIENSTITPEEIRRARRYARELASRAISDNQIDALASIILREGSRSLENSDLLRIIREGRLDEASHFFLSIAPFQGRLTASANRRACERDLFIQ